MRLVIFDHASKRPAEIADRLDDKQPDWDVHATVDPQDAMSIVRGGAVDLVIARCVEETDGGVELLRTARARCQQALRIAMVDDDRGVRMLASLHVAHRVTMAQVTAEWLIGVVQRGQRVSRLLADPELNRRIGEIDRLPSAPGLYLSLVNAVQQGAPAAVMAQMIRRDPGVAAKVLQLSNSAVFTRGKAVSDLDGALVRLGGDALCRIVLASEALDDPRLSGDRNKLQRQALLASQFAPRLLTNPIAAQQAATACILVDIGQMLPKGKPRPRTLEDDDDDQTPQVPPASAAGAYLLSLWGLSDDIVQAVAYRHCPGESGEYEFGVVGAVHVASALAAGTPVDMDYLESMDQAEQLPRWREMFTTLAGPGARAA